MRPAAYSPVTQQGRPSANHNSRPQFGQELGESVGLHSGLYKAPVPHPQHHSRNSSWAYSSEDDPPSPTRTSRACSSGARPRTGIIYPLQPRQRRPNTHIDVEAAALPEPAALQREELLPSREVPRDLTRPAQRLYAKGAVNALLRCTAQPNAHLHGGTGVFYKKSDWYKQSNI